METTKAERAKMRRPAKLLGLNGVLRLIRDVDTLVGLARDRAKATHDFGAVLGRDRSGHVADFEGC